ncbi:hypothetical protein A2W24_03590 [Microgenomates group bacterium RBG_16_45_19]|nr:MAG: hypothetical protein A2W24_03590 [Microgenomates group bacterium RBG_16_45_19]
MKSLLIPIAFDWDIGNIEKNWDKHKVDAKEAEEVFFNKRLKLFPDKKHSSKEQRYAALGVTNLRRKLTIIFTIREQRIRIISARNQSNKERKQYEK